jgi:predicted enzyme related to lactoylglutathione lyase
MKPEGITWHAIVAQDKTKFEAMRKILTGPFGLTPMMEMDGVLVYAMPNGSIVELYMPDKVPPFGYNKEGICFGWRVDDVEKASAELEAAGCELLGQINRFPEMKYAFRHFRAPDGRIYGINEQKEQKK